MDGSGFEVFGMADDVYQGGRGHYVWRRNMTSMEHDVVGAHGLVLSLSPSLSLSFLSLSLSHAHAHARKAVALTCVLLMENELDGAWSRRRVIYGCDGHISALAAATGRTQRNTTQHDKGRIPLFRNDSVASL